MCQLMKNTNIYSYKNADLEVSLSVSYHLSSGPLGQSKLA